MDPNGMLIRTTTDQTHNSSSRKKTQHFQPSPSPTHHHLSPNSHSFLTSLPLKPQTHNLLLQRHNQLNTLIEQLNDKIEKVIDRHENEFLSAYRSHVKKIRIQLDQFRASTMRMQASGAKEQVMLLEKQSAFMREQLGRVFEKLQSKGKELEELRIRLKEKEKENGWLEKQLKRVVKKMKADRVMGMLANNTIEQNMKTLPVRGRPSQSNDKNTTQVHFPRVRKASLISSQMNSTQNLWQNQRLITIIPDREVLQQVNAIVNELLAQRDRKYYNLKEKYEQNLRSQKLGAPCELEVFFLDCVETVRKELFKKNEKPQNFTYKSVLIDYQVFKKQDKVKILTRFVQNQEVVKAIYDMLFKQTTTVAADAFQQQASTTLPRANQRGFGHNLHMSCQYRSIQR